MSRHNRRAGVLGLALALFAILVGCGKGPPQLPPPEAPTVAVTNPSMRPYTPHKDFTGRLVTKDAVKVVSRVGGIVVSREFKDGDRVEKDKTVLFRIDPVLYDADVKKADADQKKAAADILNWTAQIALAEAELARVTDQLKRGVGIPADKDKADANLGVAKAQKDAAIATKAAADANLIKAQENFRYTTIYAPATGRVGRALVADRALVEAYKTELTEVFPIDPIYAFWEVDELTSLWYRNQIFDKREIPDPRNPETPLRCWITLKDGMTIPPFSQPGVPIEFIDPEIVRGTGTRTVRATFPNPNGRLSSCDSVRVRVDAGKPLELLSIPETAVFAQQRNRYVYVVDAESNAKSREVEVGARFDGSVEVNRRLSDAADATGTTESDRVIVDNLLRVRPGIAVKIKQYDRAGLLPGPILTRSFSVSTPVTEPSIPTYATVHFASSVRDRPRSADRLAGVLALTQLPIAQYPNVVPPQVVITASYPGADAKTVSETVAAPIEEQVNGVEGMMYMESQATNDGAMRLIVTFKIGTDPDMAQVLVQNRVNAALPKLPEDVRRLGVITKKQSTAILLVVNMFAKKDVRPVNPSDPNDQARYDSDLLDQQLAISKLANLQVKDEIARIDGVGDVFLFGNRDYSMRIWLDPGKMADVRMNPSEVVDAIRKQNAQVPAGQLGQPPAPRGQNLQLVLNTQGRLKTEEQFRDIVVKTGPQGEALVRVRDVARVELGAKSYDSSSALDNRPSVGLPVFQLPGGNAFSTARDIKDKMKQLRADPAWPTDIEYDIVYDPTDFVRERGGSRETLFEAIILVIHRRAVFLKTGAALIPMIAVPVSLGRYVGGHVRPRILDQQPHAVRHGARHRHRGR